MEISERYIVIPHVVHRLSGKLIAKKRGIAFNKGMESLLLYQIHRDLLDLLRRTSMQSGYGHRVTDLSLIHI